MSDIDDFDAELEGSLAANEAAFERSAGNGGHLQTLALLSPDEIAAAVPGGDGTTAHADLIRLLQEATDNNMQEAELGARIASLGQSALTIARLVPTLAAIL